MAGVLTALPACGYHYAEVYPAGYATVAVPIFENKTFEREVAYDLTEAIIKEIEQRTPYKVADLAHADTLLRGHGEVRAAAAVEPHPHRRPAPGD